MTQALQDSEVAANHRQRLLEGMAHAVASRGYADTTIADIVREAAVSRRTFYEHFNTKADCLLALYEAASRSALAVLRGAIDPARDWQEQVEKAMAAYFGCLEQSPMLVRTLFVEILGLGAEGLAVRRRANEDVVAFMLQMINGGHGMRGIHRRRTPLSREMAMAVVGGINELVLQAIEDERVDRLQELTAPAIALLRAVTRDAG
ncbi:MAG TPA: helix-turn-helix domain-containing protein [Noviherbaspirillum sp.]|uniref:TetR/AcrR family transcriptional regulator n=1 Tax=Noviherbaspirillum sp. TaxID=1926288 RepID=UPI002B483077|nr:helix-turn-helix domain-containing protein [Noviherbaspirillum sp.]HJV87511.1 helix-turn-helix domain-containing protein [Noviherbaspirillum sp.]